LQPAKIFGAAHVGQDGILRGLGNPAVQWHVNSRACYPLVCEFTICPTLC
jgi:hypothetical protein